MNPKQFIEKIGPLARKEEERTGILASLTIAQAILESGWGKSGLTQKGNALFGIKAGANWKGKVYNAKTQECFDGVNFTEITATFRAYDSWEDSIKDHSKLLTELKRYEKVVGEKDYRKACREIQAAGYATDPGYANKLINLIETHDLNRYNATNKTNTSTNKTNIGGKMNQNQFIEKLYNVLNNHKTIYAWGCFGGIMTDSLVESKAKQYPNMYSVAKKAELKKAGRQGYFGFDCVNLIKGILWGWNGNKNQTWGGAKYASNGVPDIGADAMINKCSGVSSNFNNIVPGEAVWLPGHIGVYVGDGKVIECTPTWKNGVQLTACLNIGPITGLPGRRWKTHGKMPYITYTNQSTPIRNTSTNKKSNEEVAKEVLQGKYGNGNERKRKLEQAGYNYNAIQAEVNKILSGQSNKKSNKEVAKEVLQGAYGNGNERKRKLEQAGYNYEAVQAEVNSLLKGNRKSNEEVAKEVLQGKYGNGNERKRKLEQAGYNYNAVQVEVNKLLQ